MKVLGICCSPRKRGNTEILLVEALRSAASSGADTDLIAVRDKNIKPCDGCLSCSNSGECRIKDDMREIYSKMLDADAIIWGTPVYVYNVTAQAKILIDRSFALGARLRNKVGGVVCVASSMGHYGVWSQFNAFFSTRHMISADFVYGYAGERGEIRKDKHAMKAANELGREVVLLVDKRFAYPEEYEVPIYRLVKKKYGIDMCPAGGRFKQEVKE